LSNEEANLLAQKSGPADANVFINLVHRVVDEGLFD